MLKIKEEVKEKLLSVMGHFKKCRILVVGDVGIDRYLEGKVERISPEAPVPILSVVNSKDKLGLAANCIDNICSLGAKAVVIGVVGSDEDSRLMKKLFSNISVSTSTLVVDTMRRTIVKERVVSERQQLLRIDYENATPVSSAIEKKLIEQVKKSMKSCDLVIIQDYAKGMFSESFLKSVVRQARALNKKVLIDPNLKTPLSHYTYATFMTPNLKEAEGLTGIKITDERSLLLAGAKLLKITHSESMVITRGKEGMTVFQRKAPKVVHIPTFAKEVYDVSGAGDTVISMMALAVASGAKLEEAAYLGNIAAGIVVGKRGTATVSQSEIIDRLKY